MKKKITKVSEGHTLKEFNEKYGYLSKKGRVNIYDDKTKLLSNKKYWKIGEKYYTVPFFTKKGLITTISAAVAILVATAITVPLVILNRAPRENYGGHHFKDISADIINVNLDVDQYQNNYSLDLLKNVNDNQNIKMASQDETTDNKDYSLKVSNFDFSRSSNKVNFDAKLDKNKTLKTNISNETLIINTSFKIKIDCVEDTKTIWTDIIGTFNLQFKINPIPDPSYTITSNVSNGKIEGPSEILKGKSVTLTITANTDYDLPNDIEVTNASKTYDSSKGIITISNPTGNVTINATCTKHIYTYNITVNVEHGSYQCSSETILTDGNETISIIPDNGYSYPTEVTVEGAKSTYDSETGLIALSNPNSAVIIDAICPIKTYDIDVKITNGSKISGPETIEHGQNLEVIVSSSTGHHLPEEIKVSGAEKYTYSKDTGKININNVISNISISITCKANQYDIISKVGNATLVGDQKITYGEGAEVIINPTTGYHLPDSISVTGAQYNYNNQTGTVTLTNCNDSVTIAGECVINTYDIKNNISNATLSGVTTINHGGNATLTVVPNTGYEFPTTVTADNADIKYDNSTGAIELSNCTGEVTLTGTCTITMIPITKTLQHCTGVGPTSVEYDGTATLTITADNGYHLPDSITVEGCDNYNYNSSTGAITLNNITSNVTVNVTCVADIYNINNNISYATLSGDTTIIHDGKATLSVIPNTGYELPNSVTASNADIEYNSSNGEIKLSNCIGEVTLTGTCAKTMITIMKALQHCTCDGPNEVEYDGTATLTVTAENGYHLPDSINVDGCNTYNYDNSTGAITLNNVTSNMVTVYVTCVIDQYDIIDNISHATLSGDQKITYGQGATVTINPETGYHLPNSISVTGAEFNYNSGTGVVTLSNCNAAVTISGDCIINTYNIKNSISNATLTGDTTINHGGTASLTVHPNTGYELPTTVTTDNADIQYTSSTGEIELSNCTGEVTLTGTCNKISIMILKAIKKGSCTGPTSVEYGESATFTVTPQAHYHLPDSITVTGWSNYDYDNSTGNITLNNVTANSGDMITIKVTCVADTYNINNNISNATLSGPNTIDYGSTVNLTVVPNTGYELPNSVTASNGNIQYNSATGAIVLSNCTGDVTLTGTCAKTMIPIMKALQYCTCVGPNSVEYDGTATLTVTALSGYCLPSTITVSGCNDYSYNNTTGEIILNHVTSNTVTVYVTCVSAYTITPNISHGSIIVSESDTEIFPNGNATVTFSPDTGYFLPESVTVTGASSSYTTEDNVGTINLSNPTDNVIITINCPDTKPTTKEDFLAAYQEDLAKEDESGHRYSSVEGCPYTHDGGSYDMPFNENDYIEGKDESGTPKTISLTDYSGKLKFVDGVAYVEVDPAVGAGSQCTVDDIQVVFTNEEIENVVNQIISIKEQYEERYPGVSMSLNYIVNNDYLEINLSMGPYSFIDMKFNRYGYLTYNFYSDSYNYSLNYQAPVI